MSSRELNLITRLSDLSTRSIVMCLNIPAVWFVVLYKNNLNIDKIQLTLFFYDIRETSLLFRTAVVVLIEGTSVVLKWQAVKWSMNFVLRAITLHYPSIQSRMRYRASQQFYDVTEGEVGALRKPRGPHKGFRYSVWKGARFLSSFFLNENILFYITEGEAGRKFLPFKLNGFKMR